MKRQMIIGATILTIVLCSCGNSGNNIITETSEQTTVSTTEKQTTAEITTAHETTTEETTIPDETTTEATTVTENPEAVKLYDIIMKDTSWRKEITKGATIIDVNGDNQPEFVVYNKGTDEKTSTDFYSFGTEKLTYMYSSDIFKDDLTMFVENGEICCWVSDYKYIKYDDESWESETKYSIYSLTDTGFVFVKTAFNNTEKYDKTTDIYSGEMYVDGELYGSDYIENYSKLDGAPALTYYSWYTDKANWEGQHLSNNDYYLCPNEVWNSDTDIASDIKKLVNAYLNEDCEYLKSNIRYGEVNAFKPVIYLYPEENKNVTVELKIDGQLTCTYPKYDNGWNVLAKTDGTLYDLNDGNEYSYLFWEGNLNTNWDCSEGFVVKGSDTKDFLREKLAYMGLTSKEYNDFIVYWLPLMQNNPYNLITFQTDEYTKAAELKINPQPDSLFRVFMTFKAMEQPVDIPEQKLETFERNGFTVVEWGGSEIK